MIKADEIIQVHPSLVWWSAFDPSVKCELASVAYRSLEGWILIDPIHLQKEALKQLEASAPIISVFLTNENHSRAAEYYRQEFKANVWASAKAAENLDIKVDAHFDKGIHGDLEVLMIPGATEGEVCFVAPEGIAMIGDAIVNLPNCEFSLLPEKYAWNPKENKISLKKLWDYPIEILTFAHGAPVRGKIKERLVNLLGD